MRAMFLIYINIVNTTLMLAVISVIIVACFLMNEINMIYDEAVKDFDEFRVLHQNAWKEMISFPGIHTIKRSVNGISKSNRRPPHSKRNMAEVRNYIWELQIQNGHSNPPKYPLQPQFTTVSPVQDNFRTATPNEKCGCALQATKCPSGPEGPPGDPGPAGEPGKKGIDGKPGLPGISLYYDGHILGCIKCPPGRKGSKGERGPTGPPGPDGVTGPSAPPALPGRSGPMGPPGEIGLQGEPGPPGAAGRPGAHGIRYISAKGQRGPPGPQGPPGPEGPEGEPGVRGDMGQEGEEGSQGLPGLEGQPGATGESGEPGLPGSDASYCQCPPRSTHVERAMKELLKSSEHFHSEAINYTTTTVTPLSYHMSAEVKSVSNTVDDTSSDNSKELSSRRDAFFLAEKMSENNAGKFDEKPNGLSDTSKIGPNRISLPMRKSDNIVDNDIDQGVQYSTRSGFPFTTDNELLEIEIFPNSEGITVTPVPEDGGKSTIERKSLAKS